MKLPAWMLRRVEADYQRRTETLRLEANARLNALRQAHTTEYTRVAEQLRRATATLTDELQQSEQRHQMARDEQTYAEQTWRTEQQAREAAHRHHLADMDREQQERLAVHAKELAEWQTTCAQRRSALELEAAAFQAEQQRLAQARKDVALQQTAVDAERAILTHAQDALPRTLWVNAFGQGFGEAWAVMREHLAKIREHAWQLGHQQGRDEQAALVRRRQEELLTLSQIPVSRLHLTHRLERARGAYLVAQRTRQDDVAGKYHAQVELLEELCQVNGHTEAAHA